jgi:hypothetical protein
MRDKVKGIDISAVRGNNIFIWFFRPKPGEEVDDNISPHTHPSKSSVIRAQRAQVRLIEMTEDSLTSN